MAVRVFKKKIFLGLHPHRRVIFFVIYKKCDWPTYYTRLQQKKRQWQSTLYLQRSQELKTAKLMLF